MKSNAQTLTNEWQDLVFKINNTGDFCYFEFKPDFVNAVPSSRLTENINIYFDDIVINNSSEPREHISTNVSLIRDHLLGLRIFPSVTSDFVTVVHEEKLAVKLEVFNITGQVVTLKQLARPRTNIDLSAWQNGTYLFRLTVHDKTKVMKIMKT